MSDSNVSDPDFRPVGAVKPSHALAPASRFGFVMLFTSYVIAIFSTWSPKVLEDTMAFATPGFSVQQPIWVEMAQLILGPLHSHPGLFYTVLTLPIAMSTFLCLKRGTRLLTFGYLAYSLVVLMSVLCFYQIFSRG